VGASRDLILVRGGFDGGARACFEALLSITLQLEPSGFYSDPKARPAHSGS
jgi:hypothetical protein